MITRPLREAITNEDTFAGIVCMGSSQAIGSFAAALAWSHGVLTPGGVALFADGYWKRPPADDYLQVLGATADEMQTDAGNAALARDAGYRVLHTMTSSDDEWDEYEGRYCGAVERYIDANPDDPDVDAMAKRIRQWHDAYLRWGRDTLGFGFIFAEAVAKSRVTDRAWLPRSSRSGPLGDVFGDKARELIGVHRHRNGPCFVQSWRTSGRFTILVISALSRLTICGGVFFGAMSPARSPRRIPARLLRQSSEHLATPTNATCPYRAPDLAAHVFAHRRYRVEHHLPCPPEDRFWHPSFLVGT
jgi:hypothetical protein